MSSGESPRYFEDCAVGETFEFGSYAVTRAEMVEFAERYDPQPFHVDEEAAEASMFGGLVASGWYTAAVCTRLLVDGLLGEMQSGGGRGVDDLRWHRPVRAGDALSLRAEVVDRYPSESLPGLGNVHVELTGRNQDDERVVSWMLLGLVERRAPA